jgi:hypothetical protein
LKSTKSIFLISFLWLAFLLAQIGVYANSPLVPSTGNFIKFIENKGQWQSNILFKASIPSGALFIEEKQLTYVFVDKQAIHDYHHGKKISSGKAHSIVVKLDGAISPSAVLKQNIFSEYYNYFIGNDASKWASHCNAYGSIVLKNIYNGIDLEIIGDGVKLKTNFIVSAYANPNQIKLTYQGQEDIKLEMRICITPLPWDILRSKNPLVFKKMKSSKLSTCYKTTRLSLHWVNTTMAIN